MLCVGLDGAGKTSLLVRASASQEGGDTEPTSLPPTEPTTGFNVRSATVPPDVKLEVWDVGGAEPIRQFWGRYATHQTAALVWVCDASAPERFGEGRAELVALLQREKSLRGLPLVIVASKCDAAAAVSAERVAESLDVERLRPIVPSLSIHRCSAASGDGVADAMLSLAAAIDARAPQTTYPAAI